MGGILLLTCAAYYPVLFNQLVPNWDDGVYITQNPLIASLDLKRIFTSFYASNYHPFVALTNAIEYRFFQSNPFIYHLDNLILHLLNTVLVFILVERITRTREIAVFVSLFFGIHPMHVESVAWAAERKDLLYTFFYLLALIQYLRFLASEGSRARHYILTLVFALCSLVSKSAAVTLPVLMLLVDWFQGRKLLDVKLVLEKAPFVVLSLVFGLVALESQRGNISAEAVNQYYAFHERVLLTSYATCVYLYKMFLPVNLSAIYAYPNRVNGVLPMTVYASLGVVLVTAAVAWRSLRSTKCVVFGLLFFLITIGLVLQVLPIGGAPVAERYSYVPYIGTLLIAGCGFSRVLRGTGRAAVRFKAVMLVGCALVVGIFMVQTHQRTQVWKRGDVLFEDAAAKSGVPIAFNLVGSYYYLNKEYESALVYYSKGIAMEPAPEPLKMRGTVYFELGRYNESVADLTRSIALDPRDRQCYIVRANALNKLNRFQEAVADYDVYLKDEPRESRSYFYRGIALFGLGRHEDAIRDFNTSLTLEPDSVQVLIRRGAAYYLRDRQNEALADLNRAETLNPRFWELYVWRGLVNYKLNNLDESVADFTTATHLNPADGSAYYNRALSYRRLGRFDLAVNDARTARALGYDLDVESFRHR
jgi:tetratricopeptide (TPR) repeat protein